MTCSMSAAGSCADNAADESFFGVLKRDRVNRQHCRTRTEASADIFDCIERCLNPRLRRRQDIQRQTEHFLTQPSIDIGIEPACTSSLSQLRPSPRWLLSK